MPLRTESEFFSSTKYLMMRVNPVSVGTPHVTVIVVRVDSSTEKSVGADGGARKIMETISSADNTETNSDIFTYQERKIKYDT